MRQIVQRLAKITQCITYNNDTKESGVCLVLVGNAEERGYRRAKAGKNTEAGLAKVRAITGGLSSDKIKWGGALRFSRQINNAAISFSPC